MPIKPRVAIINPATVANGISSHHRNSIISLTLAFTLLAFKSNFPKESRNYITMIIYMLFVISVSIILFAIYTLYSVRSDLLGLPLDFVRLKMMDRWKYLLAIMILYAVTITIFIGLYFYNITSKELDKNEENDKLII
jgi:hypothetical protein